MTGNASTWTPTCRRCGKRIRLQQSADGTTWVHLDLAATDHKADPDERVSEDA
jgi:uncharacterized protein YchJ